MKYTDDGDVYESIYGEKPKDVLQVREIARKKVIQMQVDKYIKGMAGAKKLRYTGNDYFQKISDKKYKALITLHKTELGKALGLLRKGDT